MPATLWLVGMMGSGKSTVAPLVAAALDRDWLDVDVAVEHVSGRRIADLFAESEEAFREVEAEVVEDVAGSAVVVACGGGVVTQPDLVELMSRTGVVVWLSAPVGALADRIGDGASRPLLAGGAVEALERLLAERADLYAAAASVTVDTDGRSPAEVASEVVRAWNASSAE